MPKMTRHKTGHETNKTAQRKRSKTETKKYYTQILASASAQPVIPEHVGGTTLSPGI